MMATQRPDWVDADPGPLGVVVSERISFGDEGMAKAILLANGRTELIQKVTGDSSTPRSVSGVYPSTYWKDGEAGVLYAMVKITQAGADALTKPADLSQPNEPQIQDSPITETQVDSTTTTTNAPSEVLTPIPTSTRTATVLTPGVVSGNTQVLTPTPTLSTSEVPKANPNTPIAPSPTSATPAAPYVPAPDPRLDGSGTVQVVGEITKQNLLPPDFHWFTDGEDSDTVGVLQDMQIRVFIMGVEVSEYLTSFSWSNNAAPDNINPTASIRLTGNNETFMLTEDNIFNNRWKDQEFDFRTSEAIKRRIFKYKSLENVYDLKTQSSRWNLNPNTCIFHSGDTIRAFARIPWTAQDAWMPIFTGYLLDPQVTVQATNSHSINAQCVTIAEKLNRARIHYNPMASSMLAVSLSGSNKTRRPPQYADQVFQTSALDTSNLFNDEVSNKRLSRSFLTNTSIRSILEYIFYGNEVENKEDSELTTQGVLNKQQAAADSKESAETKKIQLAKDIRELNGQIKVLERKKRNWIAVDPGQTQSPRVQSIDKKIEELKAELKTKEDDQKAASANPANSQNKQGQNANPTAIDQTRVDGDGDKFETNDGVVRKFGFGMLHPDLFVIEDFPYTGETTVNDAVQDITASTPASKADTPTGQTSTSPTPAPTPIESGFKKCWPAGAYNFISSPYLEPNHGGPDSNKHTHMGIDITSGKAGEIYGKPCYAPIDGTISFAKLDSRLKIGTGNSIELKGDDGTYHRFYHLLSISVSEKQRVKAGDEIGKIGGLQGVAGSGDSSGAHLHWEVSEKSAAQKKLPYLDPSRWFNNLPAQNITTASKSAIPAGAGQPTTMDQINSEIDDELNLKDSWDTTIDLEKEASVMEEWHARCLFGFANGVPVKEDGSQYSVEDVDPEIYSPKDFKNFATSRPNAWLTRDEVTFIGNNSDWLGVYSPHGKAVSVAYKRPKSGFGINRGMGDVSIADIATETATISRSQILAEFLTLIDYRWWVTGNGDVVVDFPHYDLKPENYGAWENYFRIEGEIWDHNYTENFNEIPSTFIVRGGFGGLATGSNGSEVRAVTEVIYQLPHVLIRNGVKLKTFSYPQIHHVKQLAMIGMVQISKLLANSIQLQMGSLPPILMITPNTPIYLAHADSYCLVDSTSFSWQIGGNKIIADLKLDVSAIRIRMTPEQAFLEDMGIEDSQEYQQQLQILRDDEWKSATEKEKKLNELKANETVKKKNMSARMAQKWDGGNNEDGDYIRGVKDAYTGIVRYKHIQGRGSLMMDYRKTFEQQVKDADDYRIGLTESIDMDQPQPITVGTPGLNSIQPNRSTVLKNLGDGLFISPYVPVQPSSSDGYFTQAKEPDPQVQQLIDKHFESSRVNPNAREAMNNHMNLVSGFQPNYVQYTPDGMIDESSGMGLMGLKPNVVDQLDPKPTGISVTDFKPVPSPINEANFSILSPTAKMEVQQKQVAGHPFLDPDYSMECGIAATKQLDRNSGATAPLNPLLYAYSLQYGPNDPALAEVMKENDVTQVTPENNMALTSSMQKWSYHYGNRGKKNMNYPASLEQISSVRSST
jgi:murein DD-endopeptidase MepM/ murein hydrolase activator NlpD